MSKELEAFQRIKHSFTIYVGCVSNIYTRYPHECKIIETALKKQEQEDSVVNTLKDVIAFNKRLPDIEIDNDNGTLHLNVYAISLRMQRELENQQRELLREWVLESCFPKELRALKIIKEKGIILQFIKETYAVEQYNAGVYGTLVKPLTREEYDLLKEVML